MEEQDPEQYAKKWVHEVTQAAIDDRLVENRPDEDQPVDADQDGGQGC